MKIAIKPVISQKLAESIQYYIFCTSAQSEIISYQTFPNTNLCLSVYKKNKVTHNKDINFCKVEDTGPSFSSKLWGFHEKIFNVSIQGQIDQVCILFHPGGIRNFTDIPYEMLINTADVFEEIFGAETNNFLEQLFETNDPGRRITLLERFLCKRMVYMHRKKALTWAVQQVLKHNGNIKVEHLSKEMGINNSTLYKHFVTYIGQSPKDFIKTVRFRSALFLLKQKHIVSLTDICYSSNYYDQSHFIKEFLHFTNSTPKQIRNNAVVEQEKLIWVNNSQ